MVGMVSPMMYGKNKKIKFQDPSKTSRDIIIKKEKDKKRQKRNRNKLCKEG